MDAAAIATRNTCFALILAVERDLRNVLALVADEHNISDFLPDEVRERASKRWTADNREDALAQCDKGTNRKGTCAVDVVLLLP